MSEEQMTIPEKGKIDRQARRDAQAGTLPKLKLMIATPCYMQQNFAHYTESMLATVRLLDQIVSKQQQQRIGVFKVRRQADNQA